MNIIQTLVKLSSSNKAGVWSHTELGSNTHSIIYWLHKFGQGPKALVSLSLYIKYLWNVKWNSTNETPRKKNITIFIKIFIVILLQLSQFFCIHLPLPRVRPLPCPSPHIHTVSPHTIVHGSFIHVFWLVPSPSFHRYPPFLSSLVPASLFHISMPPVLINNHFFPHCPCIAISR